MTQNKRIVLNTIATYGRSLISMVFGLFSARWVLLALGQSDFGLYGVVGSVITFITYFNLVLSGSVTRFYAFSIGKCKTMTPADATLDLRTWFNTALSLHSALAVILTCVGFFCGEYAIGTWLTIPADRMSACVWVFRISLFTAFVSMASVPYIGMYTACQNIAELTAFDLIRVFGLFVGSYFLMSASGDRLIKYACLMMALSCVTTVCQVLLARFHYAACRIVISLWYDLGKITEVMAFAFWRMFGVFGWLIRSQGSAIVVNVFFGSIANAAYSVATNLSAHTATLSGALTNAFSPALTTVVGSGDERTAVKYAIRASKFSGLLIALFAAPLICECEYVLKLWLKDPPAHAAPLCLIFLVALLLDNLSNGYMLGVGAKGRIAGMAVGEFICLVVTCPITWCAYKVGGSFLWVGYAYALAAVGTALVRVYFAKRLLKIQMRIWILNVLSPVTFSVVFASACGLLAKFAMPASILRLGFVSVLCIFVTIVCGWSVILNSEEREYLLARFRRVMTKK